MGAGIEVLRAVEGPAQPLDAPKTESTTLHFDVGGRPSVVSSAYNLK
jgi:hypothetical protein